MTLRGLLVARAYPENFCVEIPTHSGVGATIHSALWVIRRPLPRTKLLSSPAKPLAAASSSIKYGFDALRHFTDYFSHLLHRDAP